MLIFSCFLRVCWPLVCSDQVYPCCASCSESRCQCDVFFNNSMFSPQSIVALCIVTFWCEFCLGSTSAWPRLLGRLLRIPLLQISLVKGSNTKRYLDLHDNMQSFVFCFSYSFYLFYFFIERVIRVLSRIWQFCSLSARLEQGLPISMHWSQNKVVSVAVYVYVLDPACTSPTRGQPL